MYTKDILAGLQLSKERILRKCKGLKLDDEALVALKTRKKLLKESFQDKLKVQWPVAISRHYLQFKRNQLAEHYSDVVRCKSLSCLPCRQGISKLNPQEILSGLSLCQSLAPPK